jgi:hypothetical protein
MFHVFFFVDIGKCDARKSHTSSASIDEWESRRSEEKTGAR